MDEHFYFWECSSEGVLSKSGNKEPVLQCDVPSCCCYVGFPGRHQFQSQLMALDGQRKWPNDLGLATQLLDLKQAPAPGFGLPQPGWCGHLGSKPVNGRALCHSPPVYNSAFQKIFFKKVKMEKKKS